MAKDKLISASAARKAILKADPKLAYVIDSVPAVDAVPALRGRWIDIYDGLYANKVFKCSVCGNDAPTEEVYPVIGSAYTDWFLTNYCPHCGADMRGGEYVKRKTAD